jgi:hypothetical protein
MHTNVTANGYQVHTTERFLLAGGVLIKYVLRFNRTYRAFQQKYVLLNA